MTTLMSVHTSDGCIGRCDARCYDAATPNCECVCNGKNHGKGKDQAVANTREHALSMMAEYAERHGLTDYSAEVNEAILQLTLPI